MQKTKFYTSNSLGVKQDMSSQLKSQNIQFHTTNH